MSRRTHSLLARPIRRAFGREYRTERRWGAPGIRRRHEKSSPSSGDRTRGRDPCYRRDRVRLQFFNPGQDDAETDADSRHDESVRLAPHDVSVAESRHDKPVRVTAHDVAVTESRDDECDSFSDEWQVARLMLALSVPTFRFSEGITLV